MVRETVEALGAEKGGAASEDCGILVARVETAGSVPAASGGGEAKSHGRGTCEIIRFKKVIISGRLPLQQA